MKPKTVQLFPSDELGILWDTSHESVYSSRYLRRNCPCARCTESENPELSVDIGQYRITSVSGVGHYALGVQWADGHSTGIYSYEYLCRICPCSQCQPLDTK
ncbi:MAG: DUF971 domain-containing protein [Chlamydiota bacterium]|nr:DUF971 domain-containing protein [Chlamydiota bacterium]